MQLADDLRMLAARLREEEARVAVDKSVKCAHVVSAATGLSMLKKKLGVR